MSAVAKPLAAYDQQFIDARCHAYQGQIDTLADLGETAGMMRPFETPAQYAARRAAIHQRINQIVASMADDLVYLITR